MIDRKTAIAVISGVIFTSSALAQADREVSSAAAGCQVVLSALPRAYKGANQPNWYDVVCGESRKWLGAAHDVRSSYSVRLRSIVVVMSDPVNTRVLVVTQDSSGGLRVGNVTPQLARMLGQPAGARIGALDVDLSPFEKTGRITVPRTAVTIKDTTALPGAIKTVGIDTVDLTEFVAKVRAFNLLEPQGGASRLKNEQPR